MSKAKIEKYINAKQVDKDFKQLEQRVVRVASSIVPQTQDIKPFVFSFDEVESPVVAGVTQYAKNNSQDVVQLHATLDKLSVEALDEMKQELVKKAKEEKL